MFNEILNDLIAQLQATLSSALASIEGSVLGFYSQYLIVGDIWNFLVGFIFD